MVPHAHVPDVMAVSANAQWVATGAADKTINIWHPASGRQWKTLRGHGHGVHSLAFSDDGALLISGADGAEVRLWRVADGKVVCAFQFDHDPNRFFEVLDFIRVHVNNSGDGWGLTNFGVLHRFQAKGCRKLAPQKLHAGQQADASGFLADALEHSDGWWLLGSGELRSLDTTGKLIWKVALAGNAVRLIAAPEPSLGVAVQLANGTLQVFDSKGKPGPVTDYGVGDARNSSIALTADGFVAASSGRTLTLMRGSQRQELWPNENAQGMSIGDGLGDLNLVAIRKDVVVVAGNAGVITLNRHSGKLLGRIAVVAAPSDYVIAASTDGRWLLQAGLGKLTLWDMESGRPSYTVEPGNLWDTKFASFLPDQKVLLIGSEGPANDRFLMIYDLREGRVVAKKELNDHPMALATDIAGRHAFVARQQGGVGVYALPDLQPVTVLPTLHQPQRLSLDEKGERLLIGGANVLEVTDVASGSRLLSLQPTSDTFFSISAEQLSLDGSEVWIATERGVSAYGVSGNTAPRWHTPIATGSFGTQLTRSTDGKRLALLGTWGQKSAWLDTVTGRATDFGQLVFPYSAVWLDARHLVVLEEDHALRLWQVDQPLPLLEMRIFPEIFGNNCSVGICLQMFPWLVNTSDGRFDAGDIADLRSLAWYRADQPLKPLPFEWLARSGFEPRLLRHTLANGLSTRQVKASAKFDPPEVRISKVASSASDPAALRVEIEVQSNTAKLGGVRLLRDGVQVKVFRKEDMPASLAGKVRFKLIVDPVSYKPGIPSLRFEATAYDLEGVSSTAAVDYKPVWDVNNLTQAHSRKRVFLINIGVNRHENASFNLDYAANDARLIGNSLAAQLAKFGVMGEGIQVSLVSDDSGDTASKARIREAIQILAGQAPASSDPVLAGLRRADINDTVIISFAGHGLTDNESKFYLLPSDTGAGSSRSITPELLSHAIASEELSGWMDGLDTYQTVLIIDACHAAASVDAEGFVPGPMDSRSLGQLAYDKGVAVLVATQADDVALESSQLRQGLLSYALMVDGLDTKAADFAPKDGIVGLVEWLTYSTLRVPELARQIRSGTLSLAPGSRGARRLNSEKTTRTVVAQSPTLFYFRRSKEPDGFLFFDIKK
ncbi:caspase family protein [Candidatus Symbiobacter mobilis]|uniref:WD40 repeat protein n=1 Tax=Candidatus Symbiobacter mobilis CR TaxID=946483 RepID=U5N879_9BURK|nr:caspase family protein [Candidatus Symbiobacter mobilis]AGX86364.1 WD40 repeat protein [Candidatus Symbiobacter mobilis CR]